MHYKIKINKCIKSGSINVSQLCLSTGFIFDNDKLLSSEDLNSLIIQNSKKEIWIPKYGNFAFVLIQRNSIVIVTDRVGSIPLFFFYNNNEAIISDDINFILQEKQLSTDKDSLKYYEFLTSGFITNNGTFYNEILRLGAADICTINLNNKKIKIDKYFNYITLNETRADEEFLSMEFHSVLKRSFQRVKTYCKEKPIIVPLSAGLDSRLILSCLKEYNFENVLCFSYGKRNNLESVLSHDIAKKLGYRWLFIEYTRKKWKNIFYTDLFQNYLFGSDQYYTLPHIQDFIAVYELKKRKMIPDDSVFIPGHTGDFISGGHIPPRFITEDINKNELIKLIIKKHFRVNKFSKVPTREKKHIIQKIESSICYWLNKGINPGYIYEWYDWKERQPNHVLQSLRIYEYFNFDWYIPLWDTEVINYWQKIPITFKVNKKLYKHYLFNYDKYDLFSEFKNERLDRKIDNRKIFDLMSRFFLSKYLRLKTDNFDIKKYFLEYYKHPLAWYGIFGYFHTLRIPFFQNIYSHLAKYYLKKRFGNYI